MSRTSGASQVNQAIHRLANVIQQNSGAAEEMTATSWALSSQAEQLQASIAFFRIGEEAKADAPAKQEGQAPKQRPASNLSFLLETQLSD